MGSPGDLIINKSITLAAVIFGVVALTGPREGTGRTGAGVALPLGITYGGDLVSGQEIANARIKAFAACSR